MHFIAPHTGLARGYVVCWINHRSCHPHISWLSEDSIKNGRLGKEPGLVICLFSKHVYAGRDYGIRCKVELAIVLVSLA